MASAGVPTAKLLSTPRAPCVLKADGLAAGKGVIVCRTEDELRVGLDAARGFGDDVLVEELLDGPEVSVFAVCDGADVVMLAPARDFKRAYEGDTGPNTGGMGSFAPVAELDGEMLDAVVDGTVRPILAELARRGAPFVGTLFAGLMLTDDGPRVLEYNCRFGDPETQSVLPLVDGDLARRAGRRGPGVAGGGRARSCRRERRSPSCWPRATTRPRAIAGRRSRVSATPRRTVRSSSMPARRSTAAGW